MAFSTAQRHGFQSANDKRGQVPTGTGFLGRPTRVTRAVARVTQAGRCLLWEGLEELEHQLLLRLVALAPLREGGDVLICRD